MTGSSFDLGPEFDYGFVRGRVIHSIADTVRALQRYLNKNR